ncbi:uncharacterized protein KGF55_003806 [Candida pseudojiufengensis]|uniref:uncharacterized protein n=1 Tax=Candida pseudojiufengensis TaxID=497109 RepID=UPI0022253632|nr:uncharacterized protein KGF55_003806 [Candida pseudojiufengensis]KAI5961835.1 hypothetical protein KGF55_003806 [Candida pseudojiufengensis]
MGVKNLFTKQYAQVGIFGFIFCFTGAIASFGPESEGGNDTFPILTDATGKVIANIKAVIQLEDIESQLNIHGDDVKRTDTEYNDELLQQFLQLSISNNSISHYEGELGLVKRLSIHDCTTWVKGAGRCVNAIWDLGNDVWNISFKIRQLMTAKQCSEIHGQMGGVYYRYWSIGGDCGSTAEQKTIAGAIMAAVHKNDGDWLCNIYCITMTHGGTWQGTLLIGPSSDAMYADCGGQFKGCYDNGCGSLTGWYNCNS